MTRSYKYRIYPTEAQSRELCRQFRLHREVYNLALQQREEIWRRFRLSRADYLEDGRSPELRQADWDAFTSTYQIAESGKQQSMVNFQKAQKVGIREADPEYLTTSSHALGQTLDRLDKAFSAFFAGNASHPKPCRRLNTISWWFGGGAKLCEDTLTITYVPGGIKINLHRPLPEGFKPKQAVVSVTSLRQWFVCLQGEVPEKVVAPLIEPSIVALDVGVKICQTDTGRVFKMPRHLKNNLRLLAKLQREADAKKPLPGHAYSIRYRALLDRVRKLHLKIKNSRLDANHKLSRDLVSEYSTLVVERLEISEMVRKDKPRKNKESGKTETVRTEDHNLRRDCHDSAWGQLRLFLEYKAPEEGCHLVQVDPAYTTRDCSQCDHRFDHKVTTARYTCPSCGHEEPRKLNAAHNIMEKFARGEVVVKNPLPSRKRGPGRAGASLGASN